MWEAIQNPVHCVNDAQRLAGLENIYIHYTHLLPYEEAGYTGFRKPIKKSLEAIEAMEEAIRRHDDSWKNVTSCP